jgi:deoxyribodipyrimidine photo-lyase
MIHDNRIIALNDKPDRQGDYVLYWMQQSQRAEYNHALEYAVREANRMNLPLLVIFAVTEDYPQANLRHFAFMLEGLAETRRALGKRGIAMVARGGTPAKVVREFATPAALIVCDSGPLRHQRQWRDEVADHAQCRVVEIETDVVVPIEVVSDKQEYAARTIRPKLQRQLGEYLKPMENAPVRRKSTRMSFPGLDLDFVDAALEQLTIDRSVGRSDRFVGGTSHAKALLGDFLARKLNDYPDARNEPVADATSHLSPYLHFGQISPLYVTLCVNAAKGVKREAKGKFLEELIVRRELSFNYAHYQPKYDQFEALPNWAKRTLKKHERDKREYIYSPDVLEQAKTHDPHWNAAQMEMVTTGFMHNMMRMYWGKKILEWTASPREAFDIALRLNNKYELDGRDPNSYVGVAWCFGLHDRPWRERPIFGQVRYMNNKGLERKFDIKAYVEKWLTAKDARSAKQT